ncbi:hypothetical protein H6P81_001794 [Aristolochia fimbriata]|uniref:Uncharacterized protein n=1 Tax=Aristolochia fimbriata TaxID=158543 RepID=A0AAV7FB45_ARIFI|nr:hypothetical protein H6P81_001794 [Aristolochia fimbriata]
MKIPMFLTGNRHRREANMIGIKLREIEIEVEGTGCRTRVGGTPRDDEFSGCHGRLLHGISLTNLGRGSRRLRPRKKLRFAAAAAAWRTVGEEHLDAAERRELSAT